MINHLIHLFIDSYYEFGSIYGTADGKIKYVGIKARQNMALFKIKEIGKYFILKFSRFACQ